MYDVLPLFSLTRTKFGGRRPKERFILHEKMSDLFFSKRRHHVARPFATLCDEWMVLGPVLSTFALLQFKGHLGILVLLSLVLKEALWSRSMVLVVI